jgi:hypothetical protein
MRMLARCSELDVAKAWVDLRRLAEAMIRPNAVAGTLKESCACHPTMHRPPSYLLAVIRSILYPIKLLMAFGSGIGYPCDFRTAVWRECSCP